MPDDNADRLKSIQKDLDYYRTAHKNMGLGLPPTVHASKYADDVGFLMALVTTKPAEPLEKSQLEIALDHDAAARIERR